MTKVLNKYFSSLWKVIQDIWINVFWTRPDNLLALKVTISIATLVIPCVLIGQPFWGTTLALGVVGASLAESDDHPRGRLRTLVLTIFSFLFVSTCVELLRPYPYLFAFGLAVTTFTLILLGGVSPRYQGITFGALLVSIYTMLGTGIKPWYYQPILLPLGGLMYGSISLALLYARPYRLLKEQIATAFTHLSVYVHIKSTLFPSTADQQKKIRTLLAEKNISIGKSIDSSKQVIYYCIEELEGKSLEGLTPYFNKWLLLQQLHERVISSHQRYDLLSKYSDNILLIEGFGKLMQEISMAIRLYADTVLTGNKFVLPTSLRWTQAVVEKQLEQSDRDSEHQTLLLLFQNLKRITELLENSDHETTHIPIEDVKYKPAPLKQRILSLFDVSQSRFRHAIRLVICFLVGYGLINFFDIEKGDWIILTSLFVCQQSYTATRQRLFQRIIGTFVGVVSGIILSSLLPTVAGQVVLLLSSIFAFFYWLRKRYSYAVIFVTIFVVAAFDLQTGTGVAVMGPRVLDTLIGAILAFVVVRFIWPEWQYKSLPKLLHTAIDKNKRYFDTIYTANVRGEIYYHNRRTAHQADNALTNAWKGMFLEPKSKRKLLNQAYLLTYLNHSLLSYISALGAHNYDKQLNASDVKVCQQISRVLEQVNKTFITSEDECRVITQQEAYSLVTDLWRKNADTDEKLSVILHNIANVSANLLKESQRLKDYYVVSNKK